MMNPNSNRPWWQFWRVRFPARPSENIEQVLREAKASRETLEQDLHAYHEATQPDRLADLIRRSMSRR